MLIEQDGVLIYVPPAQQSYSDQRSHSGNGDGGGDGDGDGDYNSNNNDDVYTDNNDTYNNDYDARPEGDDAIDQELDCSQYWGLDDPPVECLSQGYPQVGYGNYSNTNNTADTFPTNGNGLRPGSPENGAIAQGDNMTMGTGMVGGTFVGDYGSTGGGGWGGGDGDGDNSSNSYDGDSQQGSSRYPPENLITVQIGVAMFPAPTNLDPMNRILSEVVTGILDAQTSFNSIYLGNLNPPADYRQRQLDNLEQSFEERQQQPDPRQLESHYGQTPPSDSDKHPPVDLIHAWTIMEPTYVDDNNASVVWFWTNIQYAAMIGVPDGGDSTSSNPPPRPIRKQDHIGNITYMCQLTINRTIENDALVYRLVDAIEDAVNHAYSNRHSGDAKWLHDQLGLHAVAPIGIMGLGDPCYVSDLKRLPHTPYTTPLDLQFGLREWLGMALAIGTILVTLLLFGGASYYQQRQHQKQWSTALMTEHGINDILKVGWQYHQQAPNNGLPSQPQLFLHLFEKQTFRSDDDSILHGGVEREEVARTGGILLVHDEGSREDDSSSSNRQPSSRASGEQTQSTTQSSRGTISKR